ncbi:hypothetical protein GCK32_010698, partial [Trichostrongylus colubriformis]
RRDPSSNFFLTNFTQSMQECEASVKSQDASVQPTFSFADGAVQAGTAEDWDLLGTISVDQTGAPLWSDFDRVPVTEFDEYQQTSPVVTQDATTHFDLEASCVAIQTQQEETRDTDCEAKVEMGDGEVQAVVESLEVAVGQDDSENWIKVYLAELDEEKRQRMTDIGIQTGVLARVQHIYATVDTDIPPDFEGPRPSIRLNEAEKVDVSGDQRLI